METIDKRNGTMVHYNMILTVPVPLYDLKNPTLFALNWLKILKNIRFIQLTVVFLE